MIVGIVVGCWCVGEIGADECDCAAVKDVLQVVVRWLAALIRLGRWCWWVVEWGGGGCWCWLLDSVSGGWAVMVDGIIDGLSARGDRGEVHFYGGLGS